MKRNLYILFFCLFFKGVSAQIIDTIYLKTDSIGSIAKVVSSSYPTQNAIPENSIVSANWTGNGTPGVWETYFTWDFSQLPSGAVVNTANINLYANNNSLWGYTGTPTYGNDNSSFLQRVTGFWNPYSVNWNNKPSTVTTNQVLVQQSISTSENYLALDVSDLVKDMLMYNNYTMCITPTQTTNYYNSQIFHSNNTYKPYLIIDYSLPEAISNLNIENDILIFVNGENNIEINTKNNIDYKNLIVTIFDENARIVSASKFTKNGENNILYTKDFASGIYFVRLNFDSKTEFVKKLSFIRQ